jgi:hypothetical protein
MSRKQRPKPGALEAEFGNEGGRRRSPQGVPRLPCRRWVLAHGVVHISLIPRAAPARAVAPVDTPASIDPAALGRNRLAELPCAEARIAVTYSVTARLLSSSTAIPTGRSLRAERVHRGWPRRARASAQIRARRSGAVLALLPRGADGLRLVLSALPARAALLCFRVKATVGTSGLGLLQPPELSRAAPPDRASRATIAFPGERSS